MMGNINPVENSFFLEAELDGLKDAMRPIIAMALEIEEKTDKDASDKKAKNQIEYLDNNKIKIHFNSSDWGWTDARFASLSGDMKWAWANSLHRFWMYYDKNTNVVSIDDTYDFNPKELGIREEFISKIKNIKQLRPIGDNPFAIFWIEFENKKLPIVALRRILNKFVEKIIVRFDHDKNEHIVNIKFKLPLVKDKFNWKDPDNKGKGYSIRKGKSELESKIPIQKGGRTSKKNPPLHHYSTVTDFAKFLG